SLQAGAEAMSLLPLPAGAVVVSSPRVRVRGQVRADEPLTEVALDGRPVEGFKPARAFALGVAGGLRPGRRRLKFTARAGQGQAVEQSLTLAYHPDLPRLEPTEPRSLRRPAGQLDFTLEVRLTELKGPADYKASVRVNEGPEAKALVSADRTLTAPVKLQPGHNRLVVLLKNE